MLYSDTIDDHVDEKIYGFLNPENPKSFFLFAGAGSGKTRTLVNVLKKIKQEQSNYYRLNKKNIAIITYTNVACEEIKHRLDNDSLFHVSTIHSFVWELIRHYTGDIKNWIEKNTRESIQELEEKESKGRSGTKASIDRQRQIENKRQRLIDLKETIKFTYNPNGNNQGKHSLNHSEVINIGADFLENKPLMQEVLVRKFPILLIDESQDTKKELINALFKVQQKHKNHFSLGLFGDTMQRIYFEGKEDLGVSLPKDWKKPAKKMNHRSAKRVITLINKIRENVDGQEQLPQVQKETGFVKLFIVSKGDIEKTEIEKNISFQMSEITNDELWLQEKEVKILTIEHKMVARRGYFIQLFEPLYDTKKLNTGLLDGTLAPIKLFTDYILPLINAKKADDNYTVAKIMRNSSPLLKKEVLEQSSNPQQNIIDANLAVKKLFKLWDNENDPKLLDVLKIINEKNIFNIPKVLTPIINRTPEDNQNIEQDNDEDDNDRDLIIDAWEKALESSFSQIESYSEYVNNESRFGTHQGVKGLEFPRVMVVIDDDESRGFLFSYDKLFGAKEPSNTDLVNKKEGRDNVFDRTQRLFYVTCSRAEKSLAIVLYSNETEKIKNTVIKNGWFSEKEIEILN